MESVRDYVRLPLGVASSQSHIAEKVVIAAEAVRREAITTISRRIDH